MKSLNKCAAAVAAAALVSAPAAFAAQSGPWSGPYVGGQLQMNTTSADGLSSENALGYGIYGGYQVQFSQHFVLGGDAFYNYNQETSHTDAAGNSGKLGTKVYGLDVTAGFPVGSMGTWMPYVKLGYGWDKLHSSMASSDSSTESAMRYGVGISWMVMQHLSLHAEYMYQNLGSSNANFKNKDLSIGASWRF